MIQQMNILYMYVCMYEYMHVCVNMHGGVWNTVTAGTLTLVMFFLGTFRSMSSGSSPSIWMSSVPSALSWSTRPEKKIVPPTGIIFTTSPTHTYNNSKQTWLILST